MSMASHFRIRLVAMLQSFALLMATQSNRTTFTDQDLLDDLSSFNEQIGQFIESVSRRCSAPSEPLPENFIFRVAGLFGMLASGVQAMTEETPPELIKLFLEAFQKELGRLLEDMTVALKPPPEQEVA